MNSKERAFELDFLRGIAIVMMMFMHFSYDIRYEFGCDTFEYLNSGWFWTFVHPVIIVLFVGLSGICCTFSRNNFKRGLKLLLVAMAFTVVTSFITYKIGIDLITLIENKTKITKDQMTLVILHFGVWVTMTNNYLDYYYDGVTDNMLLYPLGFHISGAPSVADYMPLIPWLGVFLICAAAGRVLYKEKKTLFAGAGKKVRAVTKPLEFMGRHSLIIYLVHQPVIYGVLYVIFKLIGKI